MQLQLRDFLAHKNTTVDLSGNHSIAVVGDNGVGKSALLESIPYAYYGQSRGSKRLMDRSRKNGDGSHEVRLKENIGDIEVEIRRGCTSKGKGTLTLYENGEKVLQGNKAQARIEELIGCDFQTYMMTAFYGLGKQVDTIMDVPPSTRLETLQSFAQVDVYKKFYERASKRLKNVRSAYENKMGRKEQLEESIVDVKALRSEKSEVNRKISDVQDCIEGWTKKERDLSAQEERYHNFRVERGRVANDIDNLQSQIESLEESISSANHEIESLYEDMQRARSQRDSSQENLQKYHSAEDYESEVEGLQGQRRDYDVRISLREEALTQGSDEVTECPLCSAELGEDTKDIWRKEIDAYRKKRDELASKIAEITGYIHDRQKIVISIEEADDQIHHLLESVQHIEGRKSDVESKHSNQVSQKSDKERHLEGLDSKMEGGEELRQDIDNINQRLHDLNKGLAGYQVRVDTIDSSISEALESKNKLAELKKEIDKINADFQALTYLSDAFSRYGIPIDLVRRIETDIECRASKVFSEFAEGYIAVRETTIKGNPGIEFYLIDRKGERTWDELSQGERAMVFVSIRVAVSQILSVSSVNYLILDEVASNLSPANRDNLIRLINMVLRKHFPGILMVSHVPMLDVFDRTVTFEEDSEGIPYVVEDAVG